jgi:fumarylacetoacetate (FAA) hydrolase
MKLISYVLRPDHADLQPAQVAAHLAPFDETGRAGVLVGETIYDVARVCERIDLSFPPSLRGKGVRRLGQTGEPADYPATMLDLLCAGPELLARLRAAVARMSNEPEAAGVPGLVTRLNAALLKAPLTNPPSVRDFYAFEQHVRTARANRGLQMVPEWYEIPAFYFSNPAAIYGPEDVVAVPQGCHAMDYELEIAIVIGRAGRDIAPDEAEGFIAGYTIMNDWSARDTQRSEMKIGLGPSKGKDFATSIGPWIVTPDELADRAVGDGADRRYNLEMVARIDGREVSHGNFASIHHPFARMIAHASRDAWLRPGDVLGSGTVGTGCLLEHLGYPGEEPRRPAPEGLRWLQPGDVVELEIERLGVLKNTVG